LPQSAKPSGWSGWAGANRLRSADVLPSIVPSEASSASSLPSPATWSPWATAQASACSRRSSRSSFCSGDGGGSASGSSASGFAGQLGGSARTGLAQAASSSTADPTARAEPRPYRQRALRRFADASTASDAGRLEVGTRRRIDENHQALDGARFALLQLG